MSNHRTLRPASGLKRDPWLMISIQEQDHKLTIEDLMSTVATLGKGFHLCSLVYSEGSSACPPRQAHNSLYAVNCCV